MPMFAAFFLAACSHQIEPVTTGTALREVEVGWGDTLWGIAEQHAMPGGYPALARLNNIRNPHYIELGQRLKVPTSDDALPLWPEAQPARAELRACRVEALPPARTGLVPGGGTGVVEVGAGVQVVASRTSDRAQLAGVAAGRAVWARTPGLEASEWADDRGRPAPAVTADLVGYRAQLDTDADFEAVVGWRLEENALGMSRWMVAVVDLSERETAAVFELANFGAGSFVARAEGGCSLLGSEWAFAHEPGERGGGWNLLARRMDLRGGDLVLDGRSGLLSRRLYDSFSPTRAVAGRVAVGDVARDLSAPAAVRRALEPMAAHRRARESATTLSARSWVALGERWDVPSSGAPLSRVGDGRSGLLYPPAWAPARPDRLAGRGANVTTYLSGWTADPVSLLWLLG